MLLKELIAELTSIIESNPEKGDVPVFIYKDDCIDEIISIDNSIDQRIDLNLKNSNEYESTPRDKNKRKRISFIK